MSKQKRLSPRERAQEVGGELFLDVKDFALVTNKSEQTVRGYIKNGNRVRKLKVMRIVGKPMIPFSELTEFPFTTSGKSTEEEVYHYDENGKVVETQKTGATA
jgi:hypothetical protein